MTTPLRWAAEEGPFEIVELLVANGADVNHQNKWGQKALQLAKANGHTACAKLLRKAMA